jgi:hypothetical protein
MLDCATAYKLMLHVKGGTKPLEETYEKFIIDGSHSLLDGIEWNTTKVS